jgi:HSP20 family molecular chaperone IbpA
MLLNQIIKDSYPNFFTFGDVNDPTDKAEINFAGYEKGEIKAQVKSNIHMKELVLTANNKDMGEKVESILLVGGIKPEDLSIKYKCGLLFVKVDKPKEKETKITIE